MIGCRLSLLSYRFGLDYRQLRISWQVNDVCSWFAVNSSRFALVIEGCSANRVSWNNISVFVADDESPCVPTCPLASGARISYGRCQDFSRGFFDWLNWLAERLNWLVGCNELEVVGGSRSLLHCRSGGMNHSRERDGGDIYRRSYLSKIWNIFKILKNIFMNILLLSRLGSIRSRWFVFFSFLRWRGGGRGGCDSVARLWMISVNRDMMHPPWILTTPHCSLSHPLIRTPFPPPPPPSPLESLDKVCVCVSV